MYASLYLLSVFALCAPPLASTSAEEEFLMKSANSQTAAKRKRTKQEREIRKSTYVYTSLEIALNSQRNSHGGSHVTITYYVYIYICTRTQSFNVPSLLSFNVSLSFSVCISRISHSHPRSLLLSPQVKSVHAWTTSKCREHNTFEYLKTTILFIILCKIEITSVCSCRFFVSIKGFKSP